ncbi:MAG: hypothetical protein MUP58_02525 [Candidatus Nanohaloarchaeota archaeon QJJ-9]|nr:hypothetical protein [Candidatus Nanohaloarchaeota archaeon QJJ-9]
MVLILISGCTRGKNNGNDLPGEGTGGLVIEEAELSETKVRAGNDVILSFKAINTNDNPLRDLKIQLSNTGDIEVEKVSDTGSFCGGGSGDLGDELRGSVEGNPWPVECSWRLDTSNVGVSGQSDSIPVTITASYNTSLEMPDWIRLFFEEESSWEKNSTSFENDEISVIASYYPEHRVDTENVSIQFGVNDIGGGRLVKRGEDDNIVASLSFSGSFVDKFSLRECTAGLICSFEKESNIESKTYLSLKPVVDYSYTQDTTVPLKVFSKGLS